MYSVKEVSETLEVSRQTIYNYLNELSKELQGHIFKIKGKTLIDDEGVKQIKIAMGLIQVPVVQEETISIDNIVKEIKNGLMEEIRAENDKLKEEVKDIKKELYKEIQELKSQNIKLMETIENKQKRSFFDNLFKK